MTGRARPGVANDGVDGRALRSFTRHIPDPSRPLWETIPFLATPLEDVAALFGIGGGGGGDEEAAHPPRARAMPSVGLGKPQASLQQRAADFQAWRLRHQRIHRPSKRRPVPAPARPLSRWWRSLARTFEGAVSPLALIAGGAPCR